MAEFDEVARKLIVKLVYYGPAMSGKSTNLMRLHDMLSPALKGDIMTLETQNDRTLFFDLFPLGFKTSTGWLVKFKLFTVPGQLTHDGTRKAVLSRADGVVFVADSLRAQEAHNAASFQNLEDNAKRVGLDFDTLPLVVQFNKRDLSPIFPEREVRGHWAHVPRPLVFATALIGAGVKETFSALLQQVYPALDRYFSLRELHGMDQEAFIVAAMGE